MLQTFRDKIKSFGMAKKLTLLLAVAIIAAMGIGSTFAYVITGTPSLVNLFINGLSPDGNLTIEKTLNHPYGKDYTVPQELAFTFDVDLGSDYAGETLETTQGEMTADADGVLTLTIAPSGRATIYDIDEDTVVTVTETNIGKGFTPAEKSKDITIEKYKDNFLTFANTYEPEKAPTKDLAVGGIKVLEGRDWLDGDSFTFALEVYDASKDKWNSLGEEKVTYEAPAEGEEADPDFNKFDFSETIRDYAFDQMGTYNFHVTEVEGTIGGITYDKTESYFDIVVGDKDMDGYLEIQNVSSTSANTKVEKQVIDITFKNSYAPEGSAKVDIEIQKVLKDLSGQSKSPAGYTFELYDDKDTLIATSEQSSTLGKTSLTLVFIPEEAGKTFSYTLKEKGAGDEVNGLTFDDKAYKLQADVIDNLDGTVRAVIYEAPKQGQTAEDAAKDADAVFKAEFTNVYDPTDDEVTLSGKKTLDGRNLSAEEFTFELYEADKEFDVAKDAKPIDTAVNKESGEFAFGSLFYKEVGTYHYVVKENSGDQIRGIKYDKTRFFVTVEVKDENGALKAVKSILNDDGAAVEKIEFVNEYVAEPVKYILRGEKVLKGATLNEKMFSFQMYAADEAFTFGGEPFSTALNDAEGDFAFDELTFSAAGTYRYVVKEDTSAPAEHVTYDKREYHVTIKVTDPGDGQLVIELVDVSLGEKDVDEIKFVNTYKAPGSDGDKPGSDDKKPDADGDKPGADDKKPTDEGPDTGDHNMLGMWIALLCTTSMLIGVILLYRRRHL